MTRTSVVMALACLLLLPTVTRAQGFGIYEQGTCAMARGGAGVADPCDDGSAIFFNPAGLTRGTRRLVSGGATLIFGSGTFTSDTGRRSESENPFTPPPHLYFKWGLTDRLSLGAGLYTPYGLGLEWPLDFEGRFLSYDSSLHTFYLQPTAAYAITDRVSVGGGLVVAIGSVELKRREDLAEIPLGAVPGLTFEALVDRETDFAETRLADSGATAVGGHFGVLVRANDRVSVGARYLTRVTLEYEGMATFTPIPNTFEVTKPNPPGFPVGTPLDPVVEEILATLPDQPATTELEMPAQFVAGVSVQALPQLTVHGDYNWVGWAAFDRLAIDFTQPLPPDEQLVQNYNDTSAVRFGMDLDLRPGMRLGAGYVYNQAAAPDETVTPLLPESRRNHITAGVGWFLNSRLTLDVAYQHVFHADRRGRVVNPPPGTLPTVALNSGTYRSRADLLGLTLTYRP